MYDLLHVSKQNLLLVRNNENSHFSSTSGSIYPQKPAEFTRKWLSLSKIVGKFTLNKMLYMFIHKCLSFLMATLFLHNVIKQRR